MASYPLKRLAAACTLLAVLLADGQSVHAFSFGPPDGNTNAPGELNCTSCHATFPLNSGAGQLGLAGLPDAYTPEALYDLAVTLSDPIAERWGFQLTILDDQGVQAGELEASDPGTQVSGGGVRTYVEHNATGTAPGMVGQKTWTFRWTAPQPGRGPVTLYVAGNAADNDGGTDGDHIYATTFAAVEAAATSAPDLPPLVTVLGPSPNPFNPTVDIRFSLAQPARAAVSVWGLDGRSVATLLAGDLPAGDHAARWDGTDRSGRGLGSGVYIFSVEVAGERWFGRMTLVR